MIYVTKKTNKHKIRLLLVGLINAYYSMLCIFGTHGISIRYTSSIFMKEV